MNGHLPLGALSGQRPESARIGRCRATRYSAEDGPKADHRNQREIG